MFEAPVLQRMAFVAAGQTPTPGGPANLLFNMGPMILIFVIMYLLLIRPQQKKAKEHREMVSRLTAGQRVVTSGGIYGTVTGAKEKTLMVEIAKNVEIEIARASVAGVAGAEDSDG